MKLALQIALNPSTEQRLLLLDVMASFNAAATDAASVGAALGVSSAFAIHRLCYARLRTQYGLSAQLAVRAIRKAAGVLARDRRVAPVFRPTSSTCYDERSFSFKGDAFASILTRSGRTLVPLNIGDYQRERWHLVRNCVDLIYREGAFYLDACIEVPESAPVTVSGFVGVDMGVVNLATTSDGETFVGDRVDVVRAHCHLRRQRLNREATRQQKRGKRPRGVRRAQQRLGRKEARFRAHENHCISKKIVGLAQDTKRGIAVEDLTHIRARIRFAKAQRARMGGWAFGQLQGHLAYKAKRAGIPFVMVNAAYTSQTCHACGHCDRENRPDQATFACAACGHSAHADVNAAQNIGARAVIVPPKVSDSPQRIAA